MPGTNGRPSGGVRHLIFMTAKYSVSCHSSVVFLLWQDTLCSQTPQALPHRILGKGQRVREHQCCCRMGPKAWLWLRRLGHPESTPECCSKSSPLWGWIYFFGKLIWPYMITKMPIYMLIRRNVLHVRTSMFSSLFAVSIRIASRPNQCLGLVLDPRKCAQ